MSRWQTLLSEDGAEWQGDQLVAFSQTASRHEAIRVPLLHQTVLSVSGQKTSDFLQGQVTCDMRTVSNASARLGSHCTAKGRALFDFIAWQQDDLILLRQDPELSELTRNHLERYGIFSRIKVNNNNHLCGIGLCGAQAHQLIEQHLGVNAGNTANLSQGEASVTRCGEGWILALSQPANNTETLFEMWLPEAQAVAFWQAIQPESTPVPPSFWTHRFIHRGIGQLNAQTSGEYIPQQLNMDIVQAISFQKGCYTGQEVIARLHYKGESKKRLGLFHTFSDTSLISGQPLYGNSGNKVGEIINAAPMFSNTGSLEPEAETEAVSPKTPWGLLAVIPKEAIHGQGDTPLFLGSDGTFPLQSYPLPYEISD